MKGILVKPDIWKGKQKALEQYGMAVTRRVIKLGDGEWELLPGSDKDSLVWLFRNDLCDIVLVKPRYQHGETVYIKEGWAISYIYDNYEPSDPMIKDDPTVPIRWLADGTKPDWCGRTRSPMHLLANKARYFIKITDVRAERLDLPLPPEELALEGGEAALPMLEKINGQWVFRYGFIKADPPQNITD